MKRIVKFVSKVIKEIKLSVWWYFNEKRILREREEEQARLDAEFKAGIQEYLKLQEIEKEVRESEERYWRELEQRGFDSAYWKKIDKGK